MTLKSIAEQAGVSISTVSRVLNDKETKAASKDVREKIWKIVRETGYIPNSNAQDLRRSSGKVMKETDGRKYFALIYARSQDNRDMFFSELARAIEYEAYKSNYILKCSFYVNDLDQTNFASIVGSNEISGLIVLGRFNENRMNAITEAQKNVVYVGLNYSTNKHDTVFCDGYKAARKAMEYLFNFNHGEIAYVGEINKENRYLGYCDALKENKIKLEHNRIVDAKQTLDGGYRAAKTLMERKAAFSAIFCANDATAMGIIKAFQEQGVKVPDALSVISIDDVEMARYFTPMLTTVHIPITELGKMAAKILIDRVEHGHTLPIKIEIPFSLSKRDSCAKR
ncbi:MAG: LacI family DNA-binding transcriptional regulator [Lachnospiraceae bacterium]|nr:LacI family DNA-binding transcriptional regulator [Lachnospiraceae bacterium]